MGTKRDEGFPQFEYGQWTFEGQIERLGAFASGSRRLRGPRRWLAVFIALAFVAPVVIGAISLLIDLL